MAKKKKLVKKAVKKPSKKKSVKKLAVKKPAKSLLNLKVSGKDRKVLTFMAKKHAGGNLSAWLRYAGSKYVPPKNVVIR